MRQFHEVLLSVLDHVSDPEDGAVRVVDHVEVTGRDVALIDRREEVPSMAHTNTHTHTHTHRHKISNILST